MIRARWALLLAWALWLFPRNWTIRAGDWHYFFTGSRLMFGVDGLHVFARHPELHMGPLSLVSAWFLRLGGGDGLGAAEVMMWTLGLVTVALLEHAARAIHGPRNPFVGLTTLAGGILLLKAWMMAAGPIAHVDDVLAMTFTAVALWAAATRRPSVVGLAVGLATASKPWGIMILPLCLAFPRRLLPRSLGIAALTSLAAWLPFIVADPGTIGTGAYNQHNNPASALHALGVHSAGTPGWVRPTQVLLALALGALAVRLSRWPAVVPVALATRIGLDPAVFPYYAPTLVLAGLVCDLLVTRRPLPAWTGVTYMIVVVLPLSLAAATLGDLRLGACVTLVLGSLLMPTKPHLPRLALEVPRPHRA